MDAPSAERDLERALAREQHAQGQIALLEQRLEAAEQEGGRAAQLELELAAARADVELLREEATELRRVNRELEATAAHFREVNDGLQSSLSWRVTRPLRAAKAARRS